MGYVTPTEIRKLACNSDPHRCDAFQKVGSFLLALVAILTREQSRPKTIGSPISWIILGAVLSIC